MAIQLDHLIVPSADRVAAAQQLGTLLGVAWAEQGSVGPFSPVYVSENLTIDFDQWTDSIPKQHYCFRVDQLEFDAILARIRAAGIAYRSLPHGPDDYKVNPTFADAPLGQFRRGLQRQPWLSRRRVEQQRTARHRLHQAVGSQRDLLHAVAIRQHRQHDVGIRADLRGARREDNRWMYFAEPLHGGGVAVEDSDIEGRLGQVPDHRVTHDAETDEADSWTCHVGDAIDRRCVHASCEDADGHASRSRRYGVAGLLRMRRRSGPPLDQVLAHL